MKYILPQLLTEYSFSNFIETGTGNGDTAAWAADLFDNVYTIEARLSKHNYAALKYGDIYNVDFLPGDSRVLLPLLLEGITEPCVFWLDAHFVGNRQIAYQLSDECPLREELITIMAHSWKQRLQHLIFIDDAALFTGDFTYPDPRHDINQWPTLEDILALTDSMFGSYDHQIYYGNIILYPDYMDEAIEIAMQKSPYWAR